MSQNFSSNLGAIKRGFRQPWILMFILPIWVFIGFYASEFLTSLLAGFLVDIGVPLVDVNPNLFSSISAAFVYALTILIVIGVPRLLLRRRTTRSDVGLERLPEWVDLLMAPAGLVVYFILSSALILIVSQAVPSFNVSQAQDTGFSHLSVSYQYVLAFLTLVVIAPLSEELLFRGYLFGKLRKIIPLWLAIGVTSILFALLHVHNGTWNVALDVFGLSIVLCLLRVYTGSIWAGVLLHMVKNFIAFYILFINPS